MSVTRDGFLHECDEDESALAAWRQGDYTLSVLEFLVADGWNGTELDAGAEPVQGLVVVTQTCDIVNLAPGKEYVVACPLVELNAKSIEDVRNGRSPVAAVLENPPQPNVVVDLGRMMSIHKSVLARLHRQEGLVTDEGRARFSEALQREARPLRSSPTHLTTTFYRNFAPNSPVLTEDRLNHGKAYRSIRTARVTAIPVGKPPTSKSYSTSSLNQREDVRLLAPRSEDA